MIFQRALCPKIWLVFFVFMFSLILSFTHKAYSVSIHPEDKKVLDLILKNAEKKPEEIKVLDNIIIKDVKGYFIRAEEGGDIDRLKISSLDGIKSCITIENLYVENCKIASMKPLIKLTKLKKLILEENPEIKKIEGLGNAKKLVKLDLDSTSIEKIENLDNCDKLSELVVSNTNLKKLSNYKHLKNLVTVWFDGTPVENDHKKHENDIKALRRFLSENSKRIRLEGGKPKK